MNAICEMSAILDKPIDIKNGYCDAPDFSFTSISETWIEKHILRYL